MHYYKFNIKDWTRSTAHLSIEEEGVYRRLIDHYYESETPIPKETKWVIRRLRLGSHEEALGVILDEFFELSDDGYRHGRCEQELEIYRAKADVNRENGKRGGRPKKPAENPDGFQKEPTDNLNHKPLTINQEPEDQQPCDQQAESPDLLGDDKKVKTAQIHIPYDQILASFGKRLPSFPQPRKLDPDRRQAVKAIWTKEEDYGSVDFFDRFFGYVAKSDFLMGETGWKSCNFDWIFKPKNFRKIIEGTYHKENTQ